MPSTRWWPPLGAAARRPGPIATIRQTLTLAGRSLRHMRRNPDEIYDLSIMPVMLLVMFTYVFGGAVLRSPGEYLQFVLPGVIVMSSMMATLTTGMGLNTDVMKGYFDRLRGMPIARSAPLSGRVLADTVNRPTRWSCSSGSARSSGSGSRPTPGRCWSRSACYWRSASRCPGLWCISE
jgi:ABC-2 type transporter